jgi:hypothetical protein
MEEQAPARACGACSLCCTVLRVDELAKLGGRPCMHQREAGGCGVHARRPGVCRAYRCAWLGGAFEERDRPDALGAVLDFVPRGDTIRLVVRQAEPDAWERSARLCEIADEVLETMPVEVRDVVDVLDPERPYRLLHPDGTEQRIGGAWIEVLEHGRPVSRQRKPWLARRVAWLGARIEAWRLARWPPHEEIAAPLADGNGDGNETTDGPGERGLL